MGLALGVLKAKFSEARICPDPPQFAAVVEVDAEDLKLSQTRRANVEEDVRPSACTETGQVRVMYDTCADGEHLQHGCVFGQ